MKIKKKYTIIGDVHGREEWGEVANGALLAGRHVVFVGDYVDSFDIGATMIKMNLEAIINLKKLHPDDVTLLIGNHDWAYIYNEMGISGFQHAHWHEYKQMFEENLELFDIAYGYTGSDGKYTLMSHAGLTYGFYTGTILPRIKGDIAPPWKPGEVTIDTPLHEILNKMKGNNLLWKVGEMRGGWGTPGPLWADYLELLDDPYPGINQVFGHTATGTVSVTNSGGDMLVKVDGWYNKKLAHIAIDL